MKARMIGRQLSSLIKEDPFVDTTGRGTKIILEGSVLPRDPDHEFEDVDGFLVSFRVADDWVTGTDVDIALAESDNGEYQHPAGLNEEWTNVFDEGVTFTLKEFWEKIKTTPWDY
jgi:hypothetical protein